LESKRLGIRLCGVRHSPWQFIRDFAVLILRGILAAHVCTSLPVAVHNSHPSSLRGWFVALHVVCHSW